MHSHRTQARTALVLAIGCGVLLIYGTLFPLSHWSSPPVSPWLQMWQHGFSNASRSDLLTNLLVYMPFGLLLMLGFSRRFSTARALFIVTLVSAALSMSLEYLQAHLPGRVPSVADILLNTVGGLTGALISLAVRDDTVVGQHFYRLRFRYIRPGPLANLGLLSLLLWALSQLSPLVPSIDLGNLRHGIKPLWFSLQDPGSLDWVRVAEYSFAITAVSLVLSSLLLLRYKAFALMFGFISIVLVLKVPVLNRQLSLEAVFGFLVSIGPVLFLYSRPARLRLMVAAFCIPGALLASGLHVPVQETTQPLHPFNWIPFRSHLENSIIGLIDIFGDIWPYIALSYIAQSLYGHHRRSVMLAGCVVIFSLTFAVEWVQQSLPGRSADITDALIATIAWLIPWLYKPLSITTPVHGQADTPPINLGESSSKRGLVLLSLSAVAAISLALVWSLNHVPAEQYLDESRLPVLPAPEELPPVDLLGFLLAHPRLPAPGFADIARIKAENPGYLRNHRKRATGDKVKTYSAFVTAYTEPGSVDLEALYQQLIGLKISWRGHEQAKQIAVAYDWLYDQWSELQREGLREKLVENGQYLIHRIREEQRLSPYNVYLYNSPFQALVATAIALYRDDPRGDVIMRWTEDYWKNRVFPVWRQIMGSNGGWHEGGEYVGIGIGQAVYQVPAMWRKATGEDLFQSEPGIRGFLDFLVYRTRPDGTHFRWGDGAFFNRRVPDQIPLAIEYRHKAAYSLNGCPRRIQPTSWPWGPLPDNSLCDPEAASLLPLAKYFDGIGMLVARSDWTENATYVTFKAGDNYWSHTHLDQGAFTIYKGGPLAIDSGAYGGGGGYGSDHHMNYAYQTIAHNTITVTDPEDTVPAPRKDKEPRVIANDGGQRRVGSGWGIEAAPLDLAEWLEKLEIYHTGRIEKYIQRNKLSLLFADITPAYTNALSGEGTFSNRTRRTDRLWRTFGYDAQDDVIVVFDQIRTVDADFRKRWLLHTIERPTYSDRHFSLTVRADEKRRRSGGQLEGHVLLPRRAQMKVVGGQNEAFLVDGKNYGISTKSKRAQSEPGAWRLEISPLDNQEDDVFLVVMLPQSVDGHDAYDVRLLTESDRIGCQITGPTRTVRWYFTPGRKGLEAEILSADGQALSVPAWVD